MEQRPELRGIPEEKILEARRLSDGKWVFKISNKKGPGDFRVSVFYPETQTRLTPSYAHFAIDLYGKLCRNEEATLFLLQAIEEIYYGSAKATDALSKLNKSGTLVQLSHLPGYSVEYTLNVLEFIFAQENVNWERDYIQANEPLPGLRKTLVRKGFMTEIEAKTKGSAIAMHLLRRVVRDKVHPVAAMREVLLRI
jgi:hypothetical protein